MTTLPDLQQFRVEDAGRGIVHLVFDCPGRTMNVLSDAAIVDLAAFADWLGDAEVRGVVIRSGKPNAFCAGADLTELGVAYDMIMAGPPRARFNVAFDHFFRLSKAIRAVETAGKPVAAAIEGVALGGGCELALGAHYRVLTDDPRIGLGLPESLVGLLPGAGGTQRLPRLVGLEPALPILLDGGRLGGEEAVAAGLVHALAAPGEAVAIAERWVLEVGDALQPWDRPDWIPQEPAAISRVVAPVRERVLDETLGHYPAPLAILDCLEFGLPQEFEGAIRSEMAIFSHLIQREEARNMIQTQFLAKTEYERLARKDALPAFLAEIISAARAAIGAVPASTLATAGFTFAGSKQPPARRRTSAGYWVDGAEGGSARSALGSISEAIAPLTATLAETEQRLADYAVVRETGYPAYLGGPLAYREHARRLG